MAYKITESCIGCTMCARQCPTGAISGTPKALHTVNPELCIDCGVCGKVCPKGAVLSDTGQQTVKVPKDQWKKPVIDENTCAGCSVCVENCPRDCLEVEGPKFHGDIHTVARFIAGKEKDCIGCGICGRVCPIAAIRF